MLKIDFAARRVYRLCHIGAAFAVLTKATFIFRGHLGTGANFYRYGKRSRHLMVFNGLRIVSRARFFDIPKRYYLASFRFISKMRAHFRGRLPR